MKRLLRALAIASAAVLLTACMGFTRLPAKEKRFAPGFYLTPTIEWSVSRSGDVENWTVHGFALEIVYLAKGIKDGKPMLRPRDRRDHLPIFRKSMTPPEIVDMTAATIRNRGVGDIQVKSVRPAEFGGKPGFRAELDLKSESGLEAKGLVAGAVVEDELYVLVFTAPRIHYFDAYAPTIEKVIASARFE